MSTLYIDESGQFQDPQIDRSCIGGILLHGTVADIKQTQENVRQALERVLQEHKLGTGLIDLHGTEIQDSYLRQKLTKAGLNALPKDKGRVVLMVFDGDPVISAIHLGKGENRYFRMLIQLLVSLSIGNRECFQGLEVNIAQRTIPVSVSDPMNEIFHKLGFQKRYEEPTMQGEFLWDPLHKEYFMKTCETINAANGSNVSLIQMKSLNHWDDPLMKLADLVCNQYFNKNKKLLSDHGNPLFFSFKLGPSQLEALRVIRGGNLIDALEHLGGDQLPAGGCGKMIGELLDHKNHDGITYQSSRQKLQVARAAFGMVEDRDYSRFKFLSPMIQALSSHDVIEEGSIDNDELFHASLLFEDALLALANHRGDIKTGLKHYSNIKELYKGKRITKDVFQLQCGNMIHNAVTLMNAFDFKGAEKCLEPLIDYCELVSINLEGEFMPWELAGKAHGTMAQAMAHRYAFDPSFYDKAKYHLERAKQHLGEKDYLQSSFRAQLALVSTKADRNGFAEELPLLFGTSTLKEACSITDENSNPFGIWLLAKACRVLEDKDAGLTLLGKQAGRKTGKYHPLHLMIGNLARLHAQLNEDHNNPWLNLFKDMMPDKEEITLRYIFAGQMAHYLREHKSAQRAESLTNLAKKAIHEAEQLDATLETDGLKAWKSEGLDIESCVQWCQFLYE